MAREPADLVTARHNESPYSEISASGDALAILEGSRLVYCNDATLKLFGGVAEDFIGRTPWDISPVSEFDGVPTTELGRSYIREAYEEGYSRFEWDHRRADGVMLHLDVSLSRIDLPEGERLLILLRDISQIVSSRKMLQGRIEFQSFLAALSSELVASWRGGGDANVSAALAKIGERYDLDLIRFWWRREGEDAVVCSHAWARDGAADVGRRIPGNQVTWATREVWERDGYHFTSLDEYPEEALLDRQFSEGEGIKSLFVTPIVVHQQVRGAAAFSTRRKERDWPEQDLEELRILAHAVGSVSERDEHFRLIKMREAELTRSQKVARLGTYVEVAKPGSNVLLDDGILRMSAEARRIFGLKPGEVSVKEAWSRIHPDDYDEAHRTPPGVAGGTKARRIGYRVVHPDGSIVRIEEWAEVEFNDACEPIRWFGTVQDVTERWRAEKELKQKIRFQRRLGGISQAFMSGSDDQLEAKIHKALRNIGETYNIDRISILRVDADAGRVDRPLQWAKEGFYWDVDSFDTTAIPWCVDHIINGRSYRFDTVDDLPEAATADREFFRSTGIKSGFNVPVYVDNKVAGTVAFSALSAPRKWTETDRDELSLFVRIVVTAWQRIQNLKGLEQSEKDLRRSQRVARIGSFVETATPGTTLEDAYGDLRMSVEACKIFQVEPGTESIELIASRIHPDDRQQFLDSIKTVGPDDDNPVHDYRVLRPDGTTIYVEDRWELDRNHDGKIVRIFGTHLDVTERVEAHLRLQDAMAEIEKLKDQLLDENLYLKQQVRSAERSARLIGENPQFASAMIAAEKVAPTDVTVLILGETGTGKELIAREIHAQSERHDRPLISVNCAALSSELIESELFGHEAGAFTGADKQRKGRFELADGGTLFLDEIGDLPADVQAKILRVLQSGDFERLGGMRTLSVDVRLITATNRNLKQMVHDGTFRADLYYRISSFPILVPPLRDRREDIPVLARHFVDKYAPSLDKSVRSIAPAMIRRMQANPWPGNVRELESFIQRALIATSGPVLDYSDPDERQDARPLADLDSVQQEHIISVLNRCNWVVAGDKGAAQVLGVPPSTLRSRMKRLGIERPH